MVRPSEDAQYHIDRRMALYNRYPEIRALEGPFYPSFAIIVILASLQVYLPFWVGSIFPTSSFNASGLAMIFTLAYLNANTLYYSLTTFVHENSHGLVLGSRYIRLVAAFIEMGMTTFGEQLGYTFAHKRLHHPRLNDKATDSECIRDGHASARPGFLNAALDLIPGVPLITTTLGDARGPEDELEGDWHGKLILVAISLSQYLFLAYMHNWTGLLFRIWTLSLYTSRWCISLHGQSISEHYRVSQHQQQPPTSSSYHALENLIGFNTGYHYEHHTMPNIAWWHLPKLRSICRQRGHERHYASFWLEWALSGFQPEYYRTCK